MQYYALTNKQIKWAWQKLREGHSKVQISEALYVDYRTLVRSLVRVYGKASPGSAEMISLVYEEE